MMTAKQMILKYLRKGYMYGGTLERNIEGHKPSNISRRLRELAHDGLINKRYVRVNGRLVVQYKKV